MMRGEVSMGSKVLYDIFLERYPKIDLHGYDRDSARMMVLDFINENVVLGNEIFIIIHGIGSGIVKNEVHETLRINKHVLEYKTDNFNSDVRLLN